MKKTFFTIILATTLLSISSTHAEAAQSKKLSQKICESLQTKIDDDCAHIMCDEMIADGSVKDMDECTSGSDYAEAAQGACDGQPTLEDLVSQYNKKHPKSHLKCE